MPGDYKQPTRAAVEYYPFLTSKLNIWWKQIINQESRGFSLGAITATACFYSYYTEDNEVAAELAFLAELVACQL